MTTATAPAALAVEEKKFNVGRALAWTFMILVIFASLFPFYWMLRTALSSNNAIYAGSGSLLPVQFPFEPAAPWLAQARTAGARAVSGGVTGCFTNSGQSCNAPTRMLVPASRQAEAIAIAKAAGKTAAAEFLKSKGAAD